MSLSVLKREEKAIMPVGCGYESGGKDPAETSLMNINPVDLDSFAKFFSAHLNQILWYVPI
jgi:hypothetical protein